MPVLLASDSFNRADAPNLGAPWAYNGDAWSIAGNKAVPTTPVITTSEVAFRPVGTPDHSVRIRPTGLADGGYYIGAALRWVSGTDFQMVLVDGVFILYFHATSNSTSDVQDNIPYSMRDGNELRVRAHGDEIEISVEGVVVWRVPSQRSPLATSAGLAVLASTPSVLAVDQWDVYDTSVVSAPYVRVRAAIGSDPFAAAPTWTDLSARVTADGLSWSRGSDDAVEPDAKPGRLSVMCNQDDGALDPGNTAGPYYPNLVQGVRIQVHMMRDDDAHPIIDGYVDGWDPRYVLGHGTCEIVATDLAGLLARTQLTSPLPQLMTTHGATHYLRLGEPAGVGLVDLGSGGANSIAVTTGGDSVRQAVTGAGVVDQDGAMEVVTTAGFVWLSNAWVATGVWELEFWLFLPAQAIPSPGPDTFEPLWTEGSGRVYADIRTINASGERQVRLIVAGVVFASSSLIALAGGWTHRAFARAADGVTWTHWTEGTASGTSGALPASTAGSTALAVGFAPGVVIDEVATFAVVRPPADRALRTDAYRLQWLDFSVSDFRWRQLLLAAGLDIDKIAFPFDPDAFFVDLAPAIEQLRGNALTEVVKVSQAEGGMTTVTRDGRAFFATRGYLVRDARLATRLALDSLSSYRRDEWRAYPAERFDRVSVLGPDDIPQVAGLATPRTPVPATLERGQLNLAKGADAKSLANLLVTAYSQPGARLSTVEVTVVGYDLIPLLRLAIGETVTVTHRRTPAIGPETVRAVVLGDSGRLLHQGIVEMTLQLSNALWVAAGQYALGRRVFEPYDADHETFALTSWGLGNLLNATLLHSTTTVRSGARSLEVTVTNAGTAYAGPLPKPANPGDTVEELSVWVRSSRATTVELYVQALTPDRVFLANVASAAVGTSTTGWTQLVVATAVMPAGTGWAAILFLVGGALAGDVHFLDDGTGNIYRTAVPWEIYDTAVYA